MRLDEMREQLIANAYLFEDPDAYAAGVDDALEALRTSERWQEVIANVPESAVLSGAGQLARPALSRSVRRRNARAG